MTSEEIQSIISILDDVVMPIEVVEELSAKRLIHYLKAITDAAEKTKVCLQALSSRQTLPQFEVLPSSSHSSTSDIFTLDDAIKRNLETMGLPRSDIDVILGPHSKFILTGEIVTRSICNQPISKEEARDKNPLARPQLEIIYAGSQHDLVGDLPKSFQLCASSTSKFSYIDRSRPTRAIAFKYRITSCPNVFLIIHAFPDCEIKHYNIAYIECMSFDFLKTFYRAASIFIHVPSSIAEMQHDGHTDDLRIDPTVLYTKSKYEKMGYRFVLTGKPGTTICKTYSACDLPINFFNKKL